MEVQCIHFSSLSSTQEWVKEHALSLDPNLFTCVTAEIQTGGKGRRGTSWVSKKGNLHASVFFTLPEYAPYLKNLAQILIYSCCLLLEKKGLHPKIKWPNDLLINDAKCAGAMAETIPLNSRIGIILGLGINVLTSVETDKKTTTLSAVAPNDWDLNLLKKEIIDHFLSDLTLLKREGFPPFRKAFEKRLLYRGEKISCKVNNETVSGELLGLTDTGELQIKKTDGTILKLHSAEIFTLRPQ